METFDFIEKIYEYKVLKAFLLDEKFAEIWVPHLQKEYFTNPILSAICEIILKYYHKYQKMPSFEVLVNEKSKKIPEDLYKKEITNLIEVDITDLEYTEDLFIKFCKKQMMKKVLLQASTYLEEGRFDELEEKVKNVVMLGEEWRDIGLVYFSDYTRLTKREERSLEFVPTLIKKLDEFLDGGAWCKTINVLLGGTGIGKTTMLINLCKAAVLQQLNCVYYTFELSSEKIALRFDSSFLGKTKHEVLSHFRKSEEALKKIYEQRVAGANLIIKEYPTGSASVDDLRTHLFMLKKRGINVGAVFVDYAEIMRVKNVNDEFRFRMKSIYEGLRGLASEFNVPVWTAHQTTREALEKADVSLKDVSEAHWVSNVSDVIIAICQTPEERSMGIFRLRILKNRESSLPDKDVIITVDYPKMLIKAKSESDEE